MSDYTKGLIITLLGVVAISPDTLLIRLIDAPTFTQLFWRGLLSGSIVILGFAALKGRHTLKAMRAQGWPGIWIAIIFSLGTILFVYSATHTSIANTLFITSTSPVFAALLSWLWLGEAVSRRTWLTILATLIGIGIIAAGSAGSGAARLSGDLAALGDAILLAATFVIARVKKDISVVPSMGLAGLLTGAIALAFAPTLAVPPDDILWMGLLGLAVVPAGFALLATGPRYLPAADVSLLLLLEALLGPLLVWWVLAEYPGHMTLIGGSVVLGAMLMSNIIGWRREHRRRLNA